MPFDIDDALIKDIASKLALDKKHISVIHKIFKESFIDSPSSGLRTQFLSHLIRSMELIIRERTGHPFFQIVLRALPENDTELEVGTAQYQKNRFFIIYYHPCMDLTQLRVCLAHELGHLFLSALMGHEKPIKKTESMASVFGCLALIDKNRFYKTRAREFVRPDENSIVDDFAQMRNRKKDRYNLS